MKKYLMTLSLVATVGFMLPTVASADAKSCEEASKEASFYQSKAAGAWAAYGSCKGFEWMGGNAKKHCENVHHHAEKWQNKANYWKRKAEKACFD